MARRTRWKTWLCGLAAAALGLTLTGCSHFIDDCTAVSPEGGFANNVKYRWHLMWNKPDPMAVLHDSQDGDMRARAYAELREPKRRGGSDADQDMIVNLLSTAARSEPSLICRLKAVEKLGEFHDPRVAAALTDAFYAPANFETKNPVVRIATIQAMAKTGNSTVLETLTKAVMVDPAIDVRLASAEGLGKFKDTQATAVLVRILKEEKDVALKNRAKESLTRITGKELPPDALAWDQYLNQNPGADGKPPHEPESRFKLAAWWGTE